MTERDGSDTNATPPELGFAESWEEALEDRSTKERVYEVATTLTEPTRVATVAEFANCSKGGARTNLEWLTELGVVERVADEPAMYRRNEAYFDFRRVHRLTREHSINELEQLIEEYEQREQTLADQFDVDSPQAVDVFMTVDFDELDTAYDRFSEWRTVRRRLREFRRARLIQQSESSESGLSVA
jgi:predicted transcriptional regulator